MMKSLLPRGLVLLLFLLLTLGCADDNDSDETDTDTPTEVEEPAPAEQEETPEESDPEPEPEPEPTEDGTVTGPSIDSTCIVWKPISEGDHNLVVLLPQNFGSPNLFILDDQGNRLEQGRYVGLTNGGRATYRFSKPGHGYPYTCFLQVGDTKYEVIRPDIRHSC